MVPLGVRRPWHKQKLLQVCLGSHACFCLSASLSFCVLSSTARSPVCVAWALLDEVESFNQISLCNCQICPEKWEGDCDEAWQRYQLAVYFQIWHITKAKEDFEQWSWQINNTWNNAFTCKDCYFFKIFQKICRILWALSTSSRKKLIFSHQKWYCFLYKDVKTIHNLF